MNTSWAPLVGELCLARWSEDMQFYRAEVKERRRVRGAWTFNVKFVEYGNDEDVPPPPSISMMSLFPV